MITKRIPTTWQDLQNMAGELLTQCGFEVKVESTLPTVRGMVEVDIYAIEGIENRRYSIVCECKHWGAAIPQHVVHSFRSVMSDLGANKGYIITTSKFQSGSFKAAELTNIELVTWEEFQLLFLDTWYSKYFYTSLSKGLYLDIEYYWVDWFDDLSREDRRVYHDLKEKLSEIEEVERAFPPPMFKDIGTDLYKIPRLPLKDQVFQDDYGITFPDIILEQTTNMEFLTLIIDYGGKVISDFKKLHTKYSQ